MGNLNITYLWRIIAYASVSIAFLTYEGLTRNVRVTYAERMPGVLGSSTKFIDFMAAYIWSFHTGFIKQAFGKSYHHYHLRAHPCLNLYLNIQSTIMNADLVQTLSLFSLDMIQKTYYCKPNEQLFPMGDHAIAIYVIKHIEGENSTKMTPNKI